MKKNRIVLMMLLLLLLFMGCSRNTGNIDNTWHVGNDGPVSSILDLKYHQTNACATYITQDPKYFAEGNPQPLHSIAVAAILEKQRPYHELSYKIQFNKYKTIPLKISTKEMWKIKYLTDDNVTRDLEVDNFYGDDGILDISERDALMIHYDLLENSSLFFNVSIGEKEFTFSLDSAEYMREISKIILREKDIPFGHWQKLADDFYRIFLECFEDPHYFVELTFFNSRVPGVSMKVYEVNDDGFQIGSPYWSYNMNSFSLTSTTGAYTGKAGLFMQSFDYTGEAKQVFDTDSLIILEMKSWNNQTKTFFIDDSTNFHELTSK